MCSDCEVHIEHGLTRPDCSVLSIALLVLFCLPTPTTILALMGGGVRIRWYSFYPKRLDG